MFAQPSVMPLQIAGAHASAASSGALETRYLVRPEGRIAYDDRGAGPLVVMVPGLGDLRGEYRLLAPRIAAAGYRVVSIDLRGHGQSSTGWADHRASAVGADVLALVRELDAGPATLVGTSMGAAAVAWVAAESPAWVSRIVAIGPFVRDIPPSSALAGWGQKAILKLAFNGPWSVWAWGKFYASLYGSRPADFAGYAAELAANLSEPGRMAALRAMIAASKADVEARLHKVAAPSLTVMGTVDPDFADPRVEADTVARLLRGKAIMVEGAGHYPHIEQPALVADAILTFMRPEQRMGQA
jgi:pimeloyl-ACP methyl ester carboxylesterase